MLKKWIKIPNDIIQWTKKWHFFHFLAWGTITPVFLFICEPSSILDFAREISSSYEAFCKEFTYVIFFYSLYIFVAPWVALFLSIIVALIKFIFIRKITVTNKFLLENKWYNIFYIISLTGIAIVALLNFFT